MCRWFRREFVSLFDRVEASSALIERARDLAEKHALRGYDAVQLAAAVQVNAAGRPRGLTCILVSADAQLNAAAVAEGLIVDDPSKHT